MRSNVPDDDVQKLTRGEKPQALPKVPVIASEPATIDEATDLARSYALDVIDILATICQDTDEKGSTRKTAGAAILDRAFGRVPEYKSVKAPEGGHTTTFGLDDELEIDQLRIDLELLRRENEALRDK